MSDHPALDPQRPFLRRVAPGLDRVHATPDYIVVDKPAGLRAVPGRGDHSDPTIGDSIETRVRAEHEIEGPVIAHRLDIETSGLMVVALNREAHRHLSMQFADRTVGKGYVAVIDGDPGEASGVIDLPIIVDWPNRPRQVVDLENGRPARTRWRVIGQTRRADGDGAERIVTRVQFQPETGRTHQLRVHAAAPDGLGCPILGDTLYGDPASAPRLLLHAEYLAFADPATDARVEFHRPAPF